MAERRSERRSERGVRAQEELRRALSGEDPHQVDARSQGTAPLTPLVPLAGSDARAGASAGERTGASGAGGSAAADAAGAAGSASAADAAGSASAAVDAAGAAAVSDAAVAAGSGAGASSAGFRSGSGAGPSPASSAVRRRAEALEAQKKRRRKRIIAVAAVLIIVAVAVCAFAFLRPQDATSPLEGFFDENAQAGQAPNKTPAELQAELNRVVEEGMFNISVASVIEFSSPSAPGKAYIENVPGNPYDMTVEVALKDTGEAVYESKGIAPGNYIEDITLSRELAPGPHDAVATFTAFDRETHAEKGRAAAEVTLIVGEGG